MESKNPLLDFLFGKETDIFNENGAVEHHFSKQWWENWESRFMQPEYNWRDHQGINLITEFDSTGPIKTITGYVSTENS